MEKNRYSVNRCPEEILARSESRCKIKTPLRLASAQGYVPNSSKRLRESDTRLYDHWRIEYCNKKKGYVRNNVVFVRFKKKTDGKKTLVETKYMKIVERLTRSFKFLRAF